MVIRLPNLWVAEEALPRLELFVGVAGEGGEPTLRGDRVSKQLNGGSTFQANLYRKEFGLEDLVQLEVTKLRREVWIEFDLVWLNLDS